MSGSDNTKEDPIDQYDPTHGSGGWIKLHRKIFKHWLWNDAEKLRAWIFLLLSANHAEAKILFDNKLITVERGSFITSQVKLAKAWRWHRETVGVFLKLLISDEMIDIKTDNRKTWITIRNYESYQAIPETRSGNSSSNSTDNSPSPPPTQTRMIRRSKKDHNLILLDSSNVDPNLKLLPSSPNGSEVIEITPRIKMTKDAAKKLVQMFGRESCEYYKLVCDDWLLETGNKKKDYAAFMRNWIRREKANSTGFYAKNRVPKQFSCAATVEANIEYYLKSEGFENGQTNDQKMLDFTEFREKNDDGK